MYQMQVGLVVQCSSPALQVILSSIYNSQVSDNFVQKFTVYNNNSATTCVYNMFKQMVLRL